MCMHVHFTWNPYCQFWGSGTNSLPLKKEGTMNRSYQKQMEGEETGVDLCVKWPMVIKLPWVSTA